MIPQLEDYLKLANISDFDVSSFIKKLKPTNVPIVGLSVSGGGTQSGLGGLDIWQAYDARSDDAIAARPGGLTQLLSYITGLSGGGAVDCVIAGCEQLHDNRGPRESDQLLHLVCRGT
ncbi:hypothetical protein FALCPG4_018218 [Fusarium falciforme]